MKDFVQRFWRDEEGAETAEWVVIAAALVAVGIFIYNGVLNDALQNVVTGIEGDLNTL